MRWRMAATCSGRVTGRDSGGAKVRRPSTSVAPVQPEDVGALVEAGDPRVSPDGGRVAFTVMTVDLGANRYRSALWLVPADGSEEARPLTAGMHRDVRPRWSPDGEQLAFVRHEGERGAQVMVLPLAGGEARQVASFQEEVEDLAWSPDGGRLACTARIPAAPQYDPERDADRPFRRITRLVGRLDGAGWTIDRPRQLHVVDVTTGAIDVRTSVEAGVGAFAWTADGTSLVVAAGVTPTWDRDLAGDLHLVAAAGGAGLRPLTSDADTTADRPACSPDGSVVAFVLDRARSYPSNSQVAVLELATGEVRCPTAALDRSCLAALGGGGSPRFDDEGGVVFTVEDTGNVHLRRVDLDGGGGRLLIGGDRQVTGFDLAGGTLAATVADATSFASVVVRDPDGAERTLWAAPVPFPVSPPRRFTAVSPDGLEVEAWLVAPVGHDGTTPAPTLVHIHGGPFSQYGNRLSDEVQVAAGAGYTAVYANPRGSSGYGEAWGRAIRGRTAEEDPGTGWGAVDAEDVLAVVDEAVRRFPELVDAERLGVLGGSYGGYLTSWLVAHDDRFLAACSERALNNMVTFAHTSDIGSHFLPGYLGTDHLRDEEELVRQSPTTYASSITTPMLLLHSEHDLRCPIEQAEDLFTRLALLGREVELVRVPGEGHELTRSGAPAHRVARFELLLEFFGRHLHPED